MRWDYYSHLFYLSAFGGDIVGSKRIEYLKPNSEHVKSHEIWALQQEDDPDLWDILSVCGQYPKEELPKSGGISAFNKHSGFIAHDRNFAATVNILENIGANIRDPESGFLVRMPEDGLGRNARENIDGILVRSVGGVQKHYSRFKDFEEIKAKNDRLTPFR